MAFDSASGSFVNPATSHTQAHTCSGSNRVLAVNVIGSADSDLITGCTYAGVAMTLVNKVKTGAGRWNYAFLLLNPASGTNNIVASASASTYIEINAASYSGLAQAGQPEATASNDTTGARSSVSVAVTTLTDNAWVVGFALTQGGSASAGSGTTLRNSALVGAIVDSGGAVTPAGSKTLTVNATANEMTMIVIALAPAGAGGGATAAGVTVSGAASLITGTASGAAGATANGTTLTAAASLLYAGGTLRFQAAGMEFGARTGLGIGTFALDAAQNYRYTVHADGLVLGSALVTSSVIATDSGGKLPDLVNAAISPGVLYRVHAIRQADGEAATFRMRAQA